MTVACLPMYDLPELREATDAWWSGLAAAFEAEGLTAVPGRLTRETGGGDPCHWRDPDLLLGQTCGYPLTHGLDPSLQLVATPCYGATGCDGPRYRSVFIVRHDDPAESLADLAGRRVAVNAPDSQSGCNALRAAVAPLAGGRPFFSEAVASGGHLASLTAVAEGSADLASIDCVTYALLTRHRADLGEAVRVLALSEAAPALPYVTAAGRPESEVAALQRGLARACAEPSLASVRAALLIDGVAVLPRPAYDRIDEMERSACELGYPELR